MYIDTDRCALLFHITEGNINARSRHSMATKVAEDSYSNVLELTEMTTGWQSECHTKCIQTWGCVFYNYNKKLSACHFADPLGGRVTDKTEDLAGWSIYKVETLSFNVDGVF